MYAASVGMRRQVVELGSIFLPHGSQGTGAMSSGLLGKYLYH